MAFLMLWMANDDKEDPDEPLGGVILPQKIEHRVKQLLLHYTTPVFRQE